MDCKICNADKSMTVVLLSTQARDPCNTNCHWPPIILPTPSTLFPHMSHQDDATFPHYIIPLDAGIKMSLSVTSQHKMQYSAYSPC